MQLNFGEKNPSWFRVKRVLSHRTDEKILQYLPISVGYKMTFVSSKYALYSTFAITAMIPVSCYDWPCYNKSLE